MRKLTICLALIPLLLAGCESGNLAPQPTEQPGDGGDTDDGPPQFEQP